jgi:hypothetical protein
VLSFLLWAGGIFLRSIRGIVARLLGLYTMTLFSLFLAMVIVAV